MELNNLKKSKEESQQAHLEKENAKTSDTVNAAGSTAVKSKPQEEQSKDWSNRNHEPKINDFDDIVKNKSKENIDKTISPSRNRTQNASSKTDRAIKELECTFKGYDTLKDFYTPNGKRTSSLRARNSISEQLNDLDGRRKRASTAEPEERKEKKQRTTSVDESYNDNVVSSESHKIENLYSTPENLIKRQNSKVSCYDSSTILSIIKPCYVAMTHLSMEIVNKHMEKLNNEKELQHGENVQLFEGKVILQDAEKLEKYIPTTQIKIPNTEITMTEACTVSCVLCKAKSKYLTSHYVRKHKTESYVSRLSENDLNYLSSNIPFAVPLNNSRNSKYNMKYEVTCGFCMQDIVQPFYKLFEHYSRHTGEFAHECSNCKLPFATKTEILRHRKTCKSCKDSEIKTIYLYPENLKTIHLYCCKMCNFVQLNEANTYRHQREHHYKRSDDPTCIEKIILCAMEISTTEDDNSDNMCFENDNDKEINVGNEPIVEDQDEQENSNDIMDNMRMPSPCTFMNELLRDEGDDFEFEIDIKPDMSSIVQIPKVEIPVITECNQRTCLDQHQPFKIEKDTTIKPHKSYKAHDASNTAFGLLKCMAIDCNFTTNIDELMINHLNEHLSSFFPPDNLLECIYCQSDQEIYNSPEMLVQHIRERHASSRFQCSICNYRSCLASNVLVHFEMFHPTQKECNVIYECLGTIVENHERVHYMTQCWMKNVKKLKCPCKF